MRKSLLTLCAASLALSAAPALAQSADARLAQYRERVERLEDQDAVENLEADYGFYFDKGLWDDVADLFTKDGSFEYGQRGVYVGRERIRHALLLFGPQNLAPAHLNTHMQLQAVIQVAPDGKSATGRFQGMVMLGEPGHNGVWGVGVYENTYAKEGGVWKISSLHFYPVALADYDGGFMKAALPMEGVSALYPPDKPPTEVYRTFPANYIPPFSYVHPVTGKSLKDLPQPKDDVVGRD
jgi:hypothetical protein